MLETLGSNPCHHRRGIDRRSQLAYRAHGAALFNTPFCSSRHQKKAEQSQSASKAASNRAFAILGLQQKRRQRSCCLGRGAAHASWYQAPILRMLSQRNVALCISDHQDAPAPWKRTADFVYIRGHGQGGRYKSHYSRQALSKWATRIRSWKKQGCDVYVYFDNDQKGAAPADALKLRQILGQVD